MSFILFDFFYIYVTHKQIKTKHWEWCRNTYVDNENNRIIKLTEIL